jgi:hypothetical protein
VKTVFFIAEVFSEMPFEAGASALLMPVVYDIIREN